MYIVHVTYVSSWMVMCFIWSRWVYTNVTMWPSIYLASRRGHTVEKCMQQRRRPYWSSPTKRRVSPLMVCEVLLPLIRIINDFCVEKADQSPPKRHSPPLATLCTLVWVFSDCKLLTQNYLNKLVFQNIENSSIHEHVKIGLKTAIFCQIS